MFIWTKRRRKFMQQFNILNVVDTVEPHRQKTHQEYRQSPFIVHEPISGSFWCFERTTWKYCSVYLPGSCDSYVKVKLLPEEKFADVKLPKTHVQKENLYPLYDEIFNMWVIVNLFFFGREWIVGNITCKYYIISAHNRCMYNT